MVVVDPSLPIDAAERGVKVGNAAIGFQMQVHLPLAPPEVGLRGIDLAVLASEFDAVKLTDETVPQLFPVGDGEVFRVFRRGADLDADNGISDPFS